MIKNRVSGSLWQKTLILTCALIAPAAAQVVSLSANQLQFSYVQGSGTFPAPQTVTISSDTPTNVGTVSVSYGAGASGWLAAIPLSVVTPVTMNVYVSGPGIAALLPGTYSASINIPVSPTTGGPVSLGVFLTVTATGTGGGGGTLPSLIVSPSTLNFAFTPGGTAAPAQTLSVSTTDNSGFLVTSSTLDGANWLTATPSQSSTTPATVTVSVNSAGLSPGVYSGSVTLTGNAQVVVPVTFTIATAPFTLTPASLTFNIPQNYGISSPQFVNVTTGSAVPFLSFPTSDSNWLQTDAPGGTTPALIGVKVNPGNLAQGTYTGKVTFQQGPAYSVDLPVTMVVGAPAVLSIAPSSISASYTIGDPGPITQTVRVNAIGSTPQTFTMATNVISGSGWLSATSNTLTTPSTLTITINPTGLAAGNYLGSVTLTPSGASASSQLISVTLTVLTAPTPVITQIQSAASGAPGIVAPGELVTLVGKGIGPKTLVTYTPTNNTVPTTLGNTTVTFDGVAAPIIYASAAATTVQVPYTVTPGAQTVLKLTYTTSQSAAVPIPTQAIYPGLFSLDSTGKGPAAALNQDFSVNSAANPAKRGSIIVLYGTGEGVTFPALTTGQIVPLTPPFPQPAIAPVVFFNGIQGTVLYAGEAPGSVSGLFQLNVQIPTNIGVGTVSVQAAFGGQGTQSGLTIAVQ